MFPSTDFNSFILRTCSQCNRVMYPVGDYRGWGIRCATWDRNPQKVLVFDTSKSLSSWFWMLTSKRPSVSLRNTINVDIIMHIRNELWRAPCSVLHSSRSSEGIFQNNVVFTHITLAVANEEYGVDPMLFDKNPTRHCSNTFLVVPFTSNRSITAVWLSSFNWRSLFPWDPGCDATKIIHMGAIDDFMSWYLFLFSWAKQRSFFSIVSTLRKNIDTESINRRRSTEASPTNRPLWVSPQWISISVVFYRRPFRKASQCLHATASPPGRFLSLRSSGWLGTFNSPPL